MGTDSVDLGTRASDGGLFTCPRVERCFVVGSFFACLLGGNCARGDCHPSGVWQRLFIRQMASSPRAGDLLVYAAYDRDFRTVKAMLSHGVSIRATDHSEWRTALHAAAIAGDLRTIEFLVLTGADVDALDRSGDSPAELAASRGHQECATFLQEHGGKRIRGDEAQHQKAIKDQVRDDIEEMNRSRPR
jgi:Ankyrin repeats (3 copies)